MKVAVSISLLASLATVAYAQQNSSAYEDCDVESYYSPLLSSAGEDPIKWTTEDIQKLLVDTHRNVLPAVGSDSETEDIYNALIDLYPGDEPGETVHLVYRNISFKAEPYANPNTWSRADIWPLEFRGVTRDSDAYTDVHGKMCADTTVLAEQGSLFFGECGTMQDQELCVAPEDAPDAQTDGKVWTPPENVKGDIARQLFYMAIRYGGEDQLNLTLVDCPPFAKGQFGYLSTLLEWHEADPVDEQEKARNSRSCERWQGNRNIFVDYPELVSEIFGEPDEIMPGDAVFSKCIGRTTAAPTASPNTCSSVEPGDIQIILTNSEEPDDIAFFTLDEIPASVGSIFITDDAWDGKKFMDKEGHMELEIPSESTGEDGRKCEGLCAGQVFSYGFNADKGLWIPVDDTKVFDLDVTGDTILTYCLNADGQPHFINGFSYAEGGWAEPGLEDYGSDKSSLPAKLEEEGSVELPFFKNYIYTGIKRAKKAVLLVAYSRPENYKGSNEIRHTIEALGSPAVESTSSSASVRVSLLAALAALVLVPMAMQ